VEALMETILVVDDSATYRKACGDMLSSHGYETIFAVNGDEAISMAKAQHPNLILMDILMPETNGFKATRKLSNDPATKDIPIVIASTKHDEVDVVYGKKLGAVDYLVKPINDELLLSSVSKALHH
jgi:twitching motility two-component system response regulator PilH